MRRRPRRFVLGNFIAAALVVVLTGGAGLGWAWSSENDPLGLRFGSLDLPGAGSHQPRRPAPAGAGAPDPARPGRPGVGPTGTVAPAAPRGAGGHLDPGAVLPPGGGILPDDPAPGGAVGPPVGPQPTGACRTGDKLVPTCGVLWGVAPGAFTHATGTEALHAFETKTARRQDIYHAYHKGTTGLFPTKEEIRIARDPAGQRILFLNWKPRSGSWAKIAKGDPTVDAYLDRLAAHINRNFPEQFFFTVHHEGEDNVRAKAGSGYTAKDYAAMYRHVVRRLRAHGVDNLVTVLVHMAYVPHTSQSWFDDMYPGDDVVDWIGFDSYAYSDPGYGNGDFAELLNRRSAARPTWPGLYNWAVTKHSDKPLMVAEWGVWSSKRNPGHKAAFYREVGQQIRNFPRIKAMVHFETPHNQDGRDSRVDATAESLRAYRRLSSLPVFRVRIDTGRS